MKIRIFFLICGVGSGVFLNLVFLSGCETVQALSSGEIAGKGKRSNYSYSLPDRYRNNIPKDVPKEN